jgi:putative secretion ATPase (PEP-CTERM system associated)
VYQTFYRFSGIPFLLTPDSRFFFGSSGHSRAIAHLVYGLAQEEGFIVITGEVGAGKTTLVEQLWSQLDRHTYVIARIVTTQVSGDDLLRLVMANFGLGDTPGLDKATLLRRFEQMVQDQRRSGRRCVLVVDEVQNLSLAALEELRMLSNITVDGRASLQTILLGQPQFRRILASPELDQLRQRVLASYHLGPLTRDETRHYILHRLTMAGWHNTPRWHDAAFAAVFDHSGGIPRRINRLCARVLLYGALEEVGEISGAMVETAGEELTQDLESGGASPNGAGPRPASARELARLGPQPFDAGALFGAGAQAGVTEGALADLRDRLELLEARVAKRDRVFQRLLTLLSSDGQGA